MSHFDIFISYAEEDGPTARLLARRLRDRAFSTWIYEENSVAGTSHLEQTLTAIGESAAFVLLASARSIVSTEVVREVEQAHHRRKPIIAVRLGLSHAQFSAAAHPVVAMVVGTAVTLEVRNNDLETVAAEIVKAMRHRGLIGTATGASGRDDVLRPPSPAGRRSRPRALAAVSVVAAIALAAALAVWLWPGRTDVPAAQPAAGESPGAERPLPAEPRPGDASASMPSAAREAAPPATPEDRGAASAARVGDGRDGGVGGRDNAAVDSKPVPSETVTAEPPPPAGSKPAVPDPAAAPPVDPPAPRSPMEQLADWVRDAEKAEDYDRAGGMLLCLGSRPARPARFVRLHGILAKASSEELVKLPACLAAHPLPSR